MSRGEVIDAIVIGAGWAGLGVSHALTARGIEHRVLERARIGETWRTQRWNSFRFNTPNSQTVLPGDSYAGPDPDGAMTSAEFVTMLESYALRHRLPVQGETPVTELVADRHVFRLTTPRGEFAARNVVIATGNQNCPVRPKLASAMSAGLHQLDACDYRSAESLEKGAVLVVGSAQSGGQITD
jgi:putative flavoprotein involved in K+ transport